MKLYPKWIKDRIAEGMSIEEADKLMALREAAFPGSTKRLEESEK